MSPIRRIPAVAVALMLLVTLPFVASCGQKGNPTLKSFEKPAGAAEIRALHREDHIVLSWDHPGDKKVISRSVEVERSEEAGQGETEGGQDFRLIARLPGDAVSFVDRDFRTGTRYFYRIRSVSARNVRGDYSPVLDVTAIEPPPAPQGLGYIVGNDSVEVSWDRVAGDVRYNVYRTSQAGAPPEVPRNATPLDENRFTDRADAVNTVYYSVRAFRLTALRDEGPPSRELQVSPAAFTPGVPSGLHFIASDRAVFLLWKENPESWVRGYRIYRRGPSDPEQVLIGFSATPAFRDGDPPAGPALYCISARGPAAESAGRECIEAPPHGER